MNPNTVTAILLIVLVASGFGVIALGVISAFFRPNVVQDRISRYVDIMAEENVGRPSSHNRRDQFSRFRYDLNRALSILASEETQLKLLSANWPISVTEYILLRFFSTGLGFLIGWAISRSIFGGIVVGAVVYLIPGIFLYRSIYQRQRKFQDQLIDVLILIRGAVQAGYSMLQSLDVVVSELPAPASEEFGRVQREVQLGLTLSQALENLSERMESDDLNLVVTAIIINNQVGGNLTTMLTAVTETIRNRIYLFGEVRALTSYARYTSYLLTLLPFLTALIIYFLNPVYFEKGLKSPASQLILGLAFVAMIVGNMWLRRIAKIEV